ncbi:MAG: phosphoribosylformylglycinamidine synthase I [Candidatus Omnitrophica bacterium]|nr:phosphoribosylformylglycinamidine synthase I [Candidatus Omnitrophota bacterium]MCM8793513.1 phosphoribosylformylglycinamidine synthase I [Candidatus Omnitrophota bacterium]
MGKPKVVVLRTAGTNCDYETAFAFERVGAIAALVHINQIIHKEKSLLDYDILAIPGGFTYGDDISAGKILANELKYILKEKLGNFVKNKRPVIGICNGFQVLVKAGLLPGNGFFQKVTLTYNDSGRFEDRWVYLKIVTSKCIWTTGLPEIIELPVAHGEGKFIGDKEVIEKLKQNGQIVFQYVDEKGNLRGYPYNPNGSLENIAGICDETGLILGLMPHPERHIEYFQHPRWTREGRSGEGDGLQVFRNGVNYVKRYL